MRYVAFASRIFIFAVLFIAVDSASSGEIAERIKTWNDLLRKHAREFGTNTTAATILVFSAHQLLTEVLDDPADFDLTENDVDTEGGGIWADELHLTEDMHDLFAERMFAALFPQS